MANKIELIQTENPYIDKIVYYLKILAKDCILKNPSEVTNNESIQSLKNANLYTSALSGELSWNLLDMLDEIPPTVNKTVLGRDKKNGLKTFYDEIIDAYLFEQSQSGHPFWCSTRYVSAYIEFLAYGQVEIETNEGRIVYTEVNKLISDYLECKNKYINGLISSDGNNLTYESNLYTMVDKVRMGRHNLLLVPRDSHYGLTSPKSMFDYKLNRDVEYTDYNKGYAIGANEFEQNKFIRFAVKYIQEHYVERNNYYRMLSGLPDFDEDGNITNRIFLGISSPIEEYSVKFENKNYVEIFTDFADETMRDDSESRKESMYIEETVIDNNTYWTVFGKTYLDELTDDEMQVLKNHGVIDKLIEIFENNLKYRYLNFLGKESVDPIKARSTVDFGYLRIGDIDNNDIYSRFKTRLDINRLFVIKTIYSEAFKYGSDYYDHFICVLIVVLSMIDILSLMQEIILNKEVLDQRIIKYIFESNGIPYYSEIPVHYQINMVKNLNTLIKYKSTNRNIVDICSLFGFDNIRVFKYYLLKTRKTYESGENAGKFVEITKDPISGEDNLEEAYDLKFIRVPYDENVSDYINDKTAEIDYSVMTKDDPTWTAGKAADTIKHQILEKEFNLVKSKYISIDSTFDIAEATVQISYLMNIMFTDQEINDNEEEPEFRYLCTDMKVSFANEQIPIGDMFLYLFALSFAYYGNKSSPPTEFGYNAAVTVPELATVRDHSIKCEKYLAIDINQDLARLATLMQAKLNKNIIIKKNTRSSGNEEDSEYYLDISGISRTFRLTHIEYSNMKSARILIDDNTYLYPYSYKSGNTTKTVYFTEEEINVEPTGGYQTPYILTHKFGVSEYDRILLTKEEFDYYTSDLEYDSEKGYSVPKQKMFYDPEYNNGEGGYRNVMSVYYFEKNEVIGNSSFNPNTLYIVNNRTGQIIKYSHPTSPFTNVPDLYAFLNNEANSTGVLINRELLQSAMLEAESIDEYNLYKWVYDAIMTSDRVKSYFETGRYDKNGKMTYYTNYKDYLEKHGVLWKNLDIVEDLIQDLSVDDMVKRETISNMINDAIIALESLDFSKYFNYSYNGIVAVSGDYLASYIIKLINFFKSYKVDIYDINAVYKFDDKFSNTVLMLDQIEKMDTVFHGLKEIYHDIAIKNLNTMEEGYEKTKTINPINQIGLITHTNRKGDTINIDTTTDRIHGDTDPDGTYHNENIVHTAIYDILVDFLKYKKFIDDRKIIKVENGNNVYEIVEQVYGKLASMISHLIIAPGEGILNQDDENGNSIKIDREAWKYWEMGASGNADDIYKVLYSYATLITKPLFVDIENVRDLMDKLHINIGGEDSEYLSDHYIIPDIIYLISHFTTNIFLTHNALLITKYEKDLNENITYDSRTNLWKDPNWSNMSLEEKEEFYKELDILDNIIFQHTISYMDNYYEENNALNLLYDITKSIVTLLKFSSKDLYESANEKDDLNFDLDISELFSYIIIYGNRFNYSEILEDKVIQILSRLKFELFDDIEISNYLLPNNYYFSSPSCNKYVSDPYTGNTVLTMFPQISSSQSSNVYQYIPVDFSKYRYFYTGALPEQEIHEITTSSNYYIAFYTNRWKKDNKTIMEPYKEMIYAHMFNMVPTECGYYEIKLNEEVIENAGFSINDIEYITFSMYNNQNFKLYSLPLNIDEYRADICDTNDQISKSISTITGEIISIMDSLEGIESPRQISDNALFEDIIYIEEKKYD